jgi:predicted GH43/DUF377 family glycosyl hydrolase
MPDESSPSFIVDSKIAGDEVNSWKKIVLLALCFLIPCALVSQPLQNRLLMATSTDGLNFKKLDKVAYNFADVPDAVVVPGGGVFLCFQGIQEPLQDVILVGRSADGITNWTFQPVKIAGIETWLVRPCDPDVVVRNGVFRLYFTGDPLNDRIPETYSAVSTDGINFTLEAGVRFSGGDHSVLDPSLLWIGDTLHYFAGGASPTQNWHALSVDGLGFTRIEDLSIRGIMMSNGINTNKGYRFYGFPNKPPPEMNIQSASSSDGRVWSLDPGIRLERDPQNSLEGMYVKDPAVVLKDSLYIMYYVTRKPEYTGIDEQQEGIPQELKLLQNYPNPFNPNTTISYSLSKWAFVSLKIFNALGQEVEELVNGERSPGSHLVQWSASNVPSGIYFYRLQAGEFVETKKMVVVH